MKAPKIIFVKHNYNSFVIDPEMHFYRCENLLGGEKDILSDGFIKNSNKYDDWSPFSFQECRDCIMLPSCFGGCCHMYFQTKNTIQCPFFKYTFKKDVKRLTRTIN